MKKVLEDSKLEYKRSQSDVLEVYLALLAAGDVAISEPKDMVIWEPPTVPWDPTLQGQSWRWTSTMPCTPEYMSTPPSWAGA